MVGLSRHPGAKSLAESLLVADRVAYVTADCIALVKTRVKAQRGASGLVVKSGFALLQSMRPDFVERAISKLLPLFCAAVEPQHRQWLAEKPFGGQPSWANFVLNHQQDFTAALLMVSDSKAATASPRINKLYRQLRPRAEQEILAAMPELGRLTEIHLQ